eukprot:2702983-Prymnesium_polylepis.2
MVMRGAHTCGKLMSGRKSHGLRWVRAKERRSARQTDVARIHFTRARDIQYEASLSRRGRNGHPRAYSGHVRGGTWVVGPWPPRAYGGLAVGRMGTDRPLSSGQTVGGRGSRFWGSKI